MEIKECPFCGSSHVTLETVFGYFVECSNCEANGPREDYEDVAVNGWNKAPRKTENENENG